MKNKGAVLTSLILSLGVSFSSCQISNNTQYAATYSGGQIPTGVYVLYSLPEASNKVFEEISQTDPELLQNSESLYSSNFNGKLVEDLVIERAKTEMKMHVGANKLFEELKLNLTDEQKDFLKQRENDYEGEAERLKELGISKESVVAYFENSQKRGTLFDHYYGEKGKNRPKDEELKKYFADNYLKLSIRSFRYGTDENKKASQEEAQKFLDSAKKNGFEEAWRLEEAEAKAKALEEERKAKEEEAAKKQAEKPAEENKTEKDEENKEPVKEDASGSDTDEKREENTEKEETPEEARDRIKNLNTKIVEKLRLKSAFKQQELNKIDSADAGEPILVDSVSNKTFFVVVKQPTDEQDFENFKELVLHGICDKPFEKLLVAKAEPANIKFNETAIAAFKPSKAQKKEENGANS